MQVVIEEALRKMNLKVTQSEREEPKREISDVRTVSSSNRQKIQVHTLLCGVYVIQYDI